MKKLKNALWTQVLRVEHGNITRIRANSEYDDVQNALTNVDIIGDEEHDKSEILFDAADFESPPEGTTLSDLRVPQENLESFV